ncbi:uncharacterized protein LOC113280181 isoform X1 [Papaver somniferum]|uniref:uncharacterized protein LOC113280181 isoform X1 n=2 Tax=Papaver somniferum TaxID=3469 RepID=UPI000E6FC81E|nr:uncharacterized protein LOC113280181 isoform X1 [Papaver somniferum]XP_026384630.1 uncharacterized protein LOC113280181 isoform X1 [Papaver somniferum]
MDVKGDQEKSHSRGGPPVFGAIFMCNRRTKQECFERCLFGLPSSQAHFVNKIKYGTVLFLFEYEERKLYGVFRANSDGAMNIKPNAFKSSGKQFPAQVSFRSQWKCHPVSESEFRDAVKDNYYTKEKFGFGLSEDQVHKLLLLFSTRIKDSSLPSKSLTTSTEAMRKCGKSGLGTVSVSGNGRRVVTTDRARTEQGRDNASVRMNSTGYRMSPRPNRISHRLGSSEKHFPRRDDRDNQLMNASYNGAYISEDPRYHRLGSSEKHFPRRDDCDNQLMNASYNGAYISEDPRYHYGNSSSLSVDNPTTPAHEHTSHSKTSSDNFYPDCRSQQIPATHLEPVSSVVPDSSYAGYGSHLIPTSHLEPESSIVPTVRFHNPNAIIDNPQDYIPLKSDVRIPEYGYHGNQDSASSNFEMYPDHLIPDNSVSRMPGLRNEIFERENTFSSSFGLASGTGASPVHHHGCVGGGLRYWKMDTSTALPLEINDNPIPQLDYYSRESQKLDPGESLGYDYSTENIKDYWTHVSLRSDTHKSRRSVFSRLNKVKGSITKNQHSKGNIESDMTVEQLMDELHYQNRTRKEMRNSGQSVARDDTNRNVKRHIALDADNRNTKWHTARNDDLGCSKKNLRGSVDHDNDDLADSKRNLGRFAVCDDDRDTSKRILRRSSSHDEERDTSKGKSRQFTASVEVRDNIKKNPNRLPARDNDHSSNKKNSGRSIARDDGHDSNKKFKKAVIEDDNNLASEEEKLMETDGEEAPLVNYKRRSETGKGQQGSGLRGCVKGFDSEVVPGKKRKLVRPSFGSVAGGEGNGCRRDELAQDFGWKSVGKSGRELKGSTCKDVGTGLSQEVVSTDCLLESKLDHDVRSNNGDYRECSNLTEQEVGDALIKTGSEGKTVDFCPRPISANVGMQGEGQCEEAVAEECLLTVQTPFQVALVRAEGQNETDEGSSHEALQGPVVGSVKTESKGSREGCSLESSGVGCYKEEDSVPKLSSRDCCSNMEVVTKDVVLSAVGLRKMVEENVITAVQEHCPSESESKSNMLNCSLATNAVEDLKEVGSRDCCSNMEGVAKDVAFSAAVGLKKMVEENVITTVQEHGPSESESKSNMLNWSLATNAVEDLKEGKSQVHVASDHKPKAQWSFQDGVVSTEGFKQTAMEVSSKAHPKLTDGSFEPQGKGHEVDLAIERNTGESHKGKALCEGLIAENLLLKNSQGLSQDAMVCDASLQQTTKRGLNVAAEEFSGGSFESEPKGKKVEIYIKSTGETLHKEEPSQEPDARDSLQQLAEEPPFCIEADKVNSEKADARTDGSLTCDGREISVEFKSSKPEFHSGKTDSQRLHHSIPSSLVKDETTAKMVDEDYGCERECEPKVSSVTMQSESEQRPLRRVKKVLKRVKKGTSNPSA